MKKLFALVSIVALGVSLAGCQFFQPQPVTNEVKETSTATVNVKDESRASSLTTLEIQELPISSTETTLEIKEPADVKVTE
ncbi:MAG: hypothetical protein CO025_13285 [Ignavibacteria bacterium CG_4_9_14_0_2_um_filter_37_13]|nr:MAG: hypothetical protein CO025_13285 [Ignavibacteria bacterium CG_4_9_14_0_2_um_filter_37_13]